MGVKVIGVDPHKRSHTAVVIDPPWVQWRLCPTQGGSDRQPNLPTTRRSASMAAILSAEERHRSPSLGHLVALYAG